MKIKTSELEGAALDWAVAKCEGVNEEAFHLFYEPTESTDYDAHGFPEFHYSTTWAQGGPIIEREYIQLNIDLAWVATRIEGSSVSEEQGPTPLIAAMRCYVAGILGDKIEIPEELK